MEREVVSALAFKIIILDLRCDHLQSAAIFILTRFEVCCYMTVIEVQNNLAFMWEYRQDIIN